MKRILGAILIVLIICMVGWMIYTSIKTMKSKEELVNRINKVPVFTLTTTDSSLISLDSGYTNAPLVLLYFNGECEYCKSETKEIVDNQDQLKGIEMIFISLEPLHKIKQFGDSFGLSEVPNVILGKIDDQTADEILGITSAPQLFIYNKEGKLTKQFKGSTKIEAIIKFANQE